MVLAVIGVAFSVAPYFVVIGIVQGLMDGQKEPSYYLTRCLLMAGSAKFYARTVTATKALHDTAVEYIGGIQVIKVFGKTRSSYERFSMTRTKPPAALSTGCAPAFCPSPSPA